MVSVQLHLLSLCMALQYGTTVYSVYVHIDHFYTESMLVQAIMDCVCVCVCVCGGGGGCGGTSLLL